MAKKKKAKKRPKKYQNKLAITGTLNQVLKASLKTSAKKQ